MIVIGDVHAKIGKYEEIIRFYKQNSICVGDFGFQRSHDWHIENVDSQLHKINFGNHDYLPYVKLEHSTSNTQYFKEYNLCTIRGANSIDKHLRTNGVDWFENEEMRYDELDSVIENIINIKPDIIISHDCPQHVMQHFFDYEDKSITRNALQILFEQYQPKSWIFGHHHRSKNEIINGTKFICLAELETLKI